MVLSVYYNKNMNISLPKLVKEIRGCEAHVRTSSSKETTFQDWSMKTSNFELVMRNEVKISGGKRNISCESTGNVRAFIKMPHSNALVIKGPKHTKLIQGDNSFVRLSTGVTNYIVQNSENKFPTFSSTSTMINESEVEDANPRSAEELRKIHSIAMASKKPSKAKEEPKKNTKTKKK